MCLSFSPGAVLNWPIPFCDFKVFSGDQHVRASQEIAIIAVVLFSFPGTLILPALLFLFLFLLQ